MRETLLLDIQYLPTWLASISAERVHPAIKDKLLAYQRECAEALHAYWTEGAAINPRAGGADLQALRQMGVQVMGLIDHAEETRLIAEQAKAGVQELRTQLEANDAEAARQQTTLQQLQTTVDEVLAQLTPTVPEGYCRWYTYRTKQQQYREVYKRLYQGTLPGPKFWTLMRELGARLGYPHHLERVGGKTGFDVHYDHWSVYKAACEASLRAIWAERVPPPQQPLFPLDERDAKERCFAHMMEPESITHPKTDETVCVPRAEIVHCERCTGRFWIGWLTDAICASCRQPER